MQPVAENRKFDAFVLEFKWIDFIFVWMLYAKLAHGQFKCDALSKQNMTRFHSGSVQLSRTRTPNEGKRNSKIEIVFLFSSREWWRVL